MLLTVDRYSVHDGWRTDALSGASQTALLPIFCRGAAWPTDSADGRLHDLRHSFAPWARTLGQGVPIIGRRLRHRRVETTARYAPIECDSVRDGTERTAGSFAADVLSE